MEASENRKRASATRTLLLMFDCDSMIVDGGPHVGLHALVVMPGAMNRSKCVRRSWDWVSVIHAVCAACSRIA